MNLLNKFASVEIKADTRISEEDRAFCQHHQEAFDKSGPALLKLVEHMEQIKAEQESILDEDGHTYIDSTCDTDELYCKIRERNTVFIDRVVRYFIKTYHVELNSGKIASHLIPEKPSDSRISRSVYSYGKMTDEEREEYHKQCEAYREQVEAYEKSLCSLPLRYERIVDEIFVQLGGFSFQERAMNEFLQRTWDCCHRGWGDRKEEEFEIKNDTLRLTGYWCSCDDRWSWGPEWKSSDDLKTLLDALVWYNVGRMGEGARWFPELYRYTTKQNEFPICNMEKVKNIKLFKNGRVDIKFRSAAYVQEFVEQCMRRRTAQ